MLAVAKEVVWAAAWVADWAAVLAFLLAACLALEREEGSERPWGIHLGRAKAVERGQAHPPQGLPRGAWAPRALMNMTLSAV